MATSSAHHFSGIVFVAVGFHVPYDLMTKQLRDFCRFEDKMCNVTCDSGVGVE